MPGRDGTGPVGTGARQGGRGGAPGTGGVCVCPSCGATVPHTRGIPCANVTCPRCGTKMTRS